MVHPNKRCLTNVSRADRGSTITSAATTYVGAGEVILMAHIYSDPSDEEVLGMASLSQQRMAIDRARNWGVFWLVVGALYLLSWVVTLFLSDFTELAVHNIVFAVAATAIGIRKTSKARRTRETSTQNTVKAQAHRSPFDNAG
jgi:hypothetical protein